MKEEKSYQVLKMRLRKWPMMQLISEKLQKKLRQLNNKAWYEF